MICAIRVEAARCKGGNASCAICAEGGSAGAKSSVLEIHGLRVGMDRAVQCVRRGGSVGAKSVALEKYNNRHITA